MPALASTKRPASQLAKLAPKLAKAIPGGLPRAMKAFYQAGDGLEVSVKDHSATIVGLVEMFDGAFKPHKPTTKRLSSVGGRPFADRFFDDDFDFDAPDALERFNVLLRLKLLVSLPGESVDIALDMFTGGEPELYMISELTAFRLAISFDDFVTNFSKFGSARWYFAFLEPSADERMNVDVAKAFAASMKPFAKADVAKLQKVLDKRTKAVDKLAKQNAKAPKPSKSRKATKDELSEIKSDAHGAKTNLVSWVNDGLVFAIASEQIGPEAAWNYVDGLRVMPAALLPRVLAAKRNKEQDKLLWGRVDQLVDVKIPKGTKLDPLLADACAVIARASGKDVPLPARYEAALGTLIDADKLTVPGLGEEPTEPRAIARYRRDRLLALGTALVGEQRFREILTEAYRSGELPRRESLLIIAPAIELTDLSKVADAISVGALAELAAANKWSKSALKAQGDKHVSAKNAVSYALALM